MLKPIKNKPTAHSECLPRPLILFASFKKERGKNRPENKVQANLEIPAVLPHISIILDHPTVGPQLDFDNKHRHFLANLKIDGKGHYDNYHGRVKVRGRGNTTWLYMPKKPYKLILQNPAPLFGLPAYKKWILLNEYLDGSLLYNSVPFTTARLLGMPFTHHPIPVELSINGNHLGVYAFMEHKEVGVNRIAIGKKGYLLELGSYFDQKQQFKSTYFKLPVMVKYPKKLNKEEFIQLKKTFTKWEALVFDRSFPHNEYLDCFDAEAFANFMIVHFLTANEEFNHPKNTHLYKKHLGKFCFGVVWDFDWAFGYEQEGRHFEENTVERLPLWEGNNPGTIFFKQLLSDPYLQKLIRIRWKDFYENRFDQLLNSIKAYSAAIDLGLQKDHSVWGKRGSTGNAKKDLEKLMKWLKARAEFIDNHLISFKEKP